MKKQQFRTVLSFLLSFIHLFFQNCIVWVNICKTSSSISFLSRSNIITPFSLKDGFPLCEAAEVSQRKEVIVCHQIHDPPSAFNNWPGLKWVQGSKVKAFD